MSRSWQFWLGLLVSAVFLYLALVGLRLDEVWQNIRTARYAWLIPGVAVYFLAVWGRTWRWHYLLASIQKIKLSSLFPVVVIGYMGNNIYPARAGEVLRAYVLKRREGVSISSSLATILVERVFDGVVMLFFIFVSLPFAPMPPYLRQLVVWSSVLFFGVLGGFFLVASKPDWAKSLYYRTIESFIPARFRAKVEGILDRFMEGLGGLRRPQDVLMIFFTSIFIWLTETTKYWFVMHGFEFHVPFYVLMLMTAVVNLATTLPSSPGYIGTFDAPGIRILVQFGVPGPIAAGYTLVLHAALWLPITLLGIFYMLKESIAWKEVQADVAGGTGK
jgi:uncharacterized protein (TIRG00374 family)